MIKHIYRNVGRCVYYCRSDNVETKAHGACARGFLLGLHDDRSRPGRGAEAVVEGAAAGREQVAAATAPAAVAERDVVRRGEAARARRVDAGRAAGVHVARAAADAVDAARAECDRRRRPVPRRKRVRRRADKVELRVRVREPVKHLLVGHEVRRGVGRGSTTGRGDWRAHAEARHGQHGERSTKEGVRELHACDV